MSTPNFKPNTLFTRDNLYILRGMNSECIDLIYLDPPFNSKKNYSMPLPIKDENILASFKDVWKPSDIDDALHDELQKTEPCLYEIIKGTEKSHSRSMFSYLIYMSMRLIEMKRVLKSTGSIYLHCDPTASHYLKIVMDCIFGKKNFRNEIVWCYRGGGVPKSDFAKKHDVIFRYSKTEEVIFNVDDVRIPYSDSVLESSESRYDKAYRGDKVYSGYRPNKLGKHPEDWWTIQPLMPSDKKERTGHKTQKPLKLLEKIILASSNKGDIILDPFCGCTTAMVAAEKLHRKWVGVDVSPFAKYYVKYRIEKELQKNIKVVFLSDISGRNDINQEELSDWEYKKKLYEDQQEKCAGCTHYYHQKDLTVDHIIPTAKGGQDTQDNKQLLCFHCNTTKGTSSMEALKHKLRKAGILEEHE